MRTYSIQGLEPRAIKLVDQVFPVLRCRRIAIFFGLSDTHVKTSSYPTTLPLYKLINHQLSQHGVSLYIYR